MPRLKCRLKEFIDDNPDLDQITVARETQLSKNTINAYYNNNMLRVDEKTAIALCEFFRCELGEMFYVDWEAPDRD